MAFTASEPDITCPEAITCISDGASLGLGGGLCGGIPMGIGPEPAPLLDSELVILLTDVIDVLVVLLLLDNTVDDEDPLARLIGAAVIEL